MPFILDDSYIALNIFRDLVATLLLKSAPIALITASGGAVAGGCEVTNISASQHRGAKRLPSSGAQTFLS